MSLLSENHWFFCDNHQKQPCLAIRAHSEIFWKKRPLMVLMRNSKLVLVLQLDSHSKNASVRPLCNRWPIQLCTGGYTKWKLFFVKTKIFLWPYNSFLSNDRFFIEFNVWQMCLSVILYTVITVFYFFVYLSSLFLSQLCFQSNSNDN